MRGLPQATKLYGGVMVGRREDSTSTFTPRPASSPVRFSAGPGMNPVQITSVALSVLTASAMAL